MQFDSVIRGARIVDGTGAPWRLGDVGIKKGRIAFMGELPGDAVAAEILDAEGRVLSPGFIDIHTHADFFLLRKPDLPSTLLQGVTTLAIGQCGVSPAPVSDDILPLLDRYCGFIKAGADPDWRWRSFDQWLSVLEELPLGANVVAFFGHGTIRLNVMGFDDRKPSTGEVEAMRRLVEECMDAGAFGMTSGLGYAPGIYASPEEVALVAAGLTSSGGLYLSHMRNQSDRVLDSIRETIEVGRRCGIPVQISHLKAKERMVAGIGERIFALMEKGRAEEVDITADQYPYSASSTTLRSILPAWVHEGGVDRIVERLSDRGTRRRIHEEILSSGRWKRRMENCDGPGGILISDTPGTPDFVGRRLPEVGEMLGTDPLDAALEIIRINGGADTACFFSLREDDVRTVMIHPLVMVASDGIPPAPGGNCHPRVNGSFPRVLGRYVREQGILSLEEAVRKMTSLPAARLGLKRKGIIREGMDADLVLFDPETIRACADFENPHRPPEGIDSVFVSGKRAVRAGKITGGRFGEVLRRR